MTRWRTGSPSTSSGTPAATGVIQGSVVVLRNADAASWPRRAGARSTRAVGPATADLNRATGSLRQPGSAWKPLVYLAAFRQNLNLDTTVPDEPISVSMGADRPVKWINNYDNEFKGPMPIRQALAESRNAVAVWLTREIGLDKVISISHEMGIRTPVQPYITTALGSSEVRLLELAERLSRHGLGSPGGAVQSSIASPTRAGAALYEAGRGVVVTIDSSYLRLIQEGLRGVIRLPAGTAHALAGRDFPIPVMGKTGTDQRLPRRAVRGIDLRAAGDHGRGPDRLRRQPRTREKETGGARALPISARSCSASTSGSSWDQCRSSRARSSTGSTCTWRDRPPHSVAPPPSVDQGPLSLRERRH